MAPRFILDELPQLIRGVASRPWFELFADEVCQFLVHVADELHAFHHRVQVFALRIIAFLEVVELDIRCFLRVVRLKADAAGSIVGMGFQNGPGKAVVKTLCRQGISLAVAGEISGQPEDVKVWLRLVRRRFLDDRDERAV